MIIIARKRDVNEKTFCRLKSFLNMNKLYAHSQETYEGKMFIAFVSLIILGEYRYSIKKILNRKTSETTSTTLYELKKFQIYRKMDGEWSPVYAMTSKMKEIFAALGLEAEEVEKCVRNNLKDNVTFE